MTPPPALLRERFTYLPESTPAPTVERDLEQVIRLLADLLLGPSRDARQARA